MIWQACLDVALCAAVTLGVVAFCLLGHWAMVGRDAA